MLDRKTKNIDAGIELLKDRKKGNECWCVFALILGAVMVISGALLKDHFLSVMGISMLIVALAYEMFDISYRFLIQDRKIMNNQRDHTALLIDVLDELDVLKNKTKKVKKK